MLHVFCAGLTRAEKEMIVTVTSAANKCLYCVISHSAQYRLFSKDRYKADQVGHFSYNTVHIYTGLCYRSLTLQLLKYLEVH